MPAQNAIGPADNLPVGCIAVLPGDRDTMSLLLSYYYYYCYYCCYYCVIKSVVQVVMTSVWATCNRETKLFRLF